LDPDTSPPASSFLSCWLPQGSQWWQNAVKASLTGISITFDYWNMLVGRCVSCMHKQTCMDDISVWRSLLRLVCWTGGSAMPLWLCGQCACNIFKSSGISSCFTLGLHAAVTTNHTSSPGQPALLLPLFQKPPLRVPSLPDCDDFQRGPILRCHSGLRAWGTHVQFRA
jgi:hypothetical protein